MKTMLQAAVAAGLLVAGGAACAGDLTSTVTLTSDDDWRGIMRTTTSCRLTPPSPGRIDRTAFAVQGE